MHDAELLDFDEAVAFLKTTSSTLYKWLQAGKVPGHKLGRQWRFSRKELEAHLAGNLPQNRIQNEIENLRSFFEKREKWHREQPKDSAGRILKMDVRIQELSEQLLWDAHDHGAHVIHVSPTKGRFEVAYRDSGALEKITEMQEDLFVEMDAALRASSSPVRDESSRRLYLQRGDSEGLQVRYQKIETVTGPRLTLRLWTVDQMTVALDRIMKEPTQLSAMKRWLAASHGLIVVAGGPGSGKTTTLYSCLGELRREGRVIFTLEDPAEVIIEGIQQVEIPRRRREDFEQAFEKIYGSDPDVIVLGLGSVLGLEAVVVENAIRAANTGHLVLLQLDYSATQEILDLLTKGPFSAKELLLGVSLQSRKDGASGPVFELVSKESF